MTGPFERTITRVVTDHSTSEFTLIEDVTTVLAGNDHLTITAWKAHNIADGIIYNGPEMLPVHYSEVEDQSALFIQTSDDAVIDLSGGIRRIDVDGHATTIFDSGMAIYTLDDNFLLGLSLHAELSEQGNSLELSFENRNVHRVDQATIALIGGTVTFDHSHFEIA